MDSYEATGLVFSKIKRLEPENASKIMGFLLIQDLSDKDLIRLAFGPDNVLHSIVLKAKSQLGLLSNNPSGPISPIARPTVPTPPPPPQLFSQSSPRVPVNHGGCFGFSRLPSSPSSNSSGFPNNPISPNSSPLLSYDNIRAASISASPFSRQSNGNTSRNGSGSEFLDENQLSEYLSFLNDSSKNEELVEPRLELGYGSNAHLHKRSHSASDVCLGSEDAVFGTGFRPCVYFSRGFCKNGNNCKFVHSDFIDSFDGLNPTVGSPNKFDGFKQHEMIGLKAAQQHRLAVATQFMGGASSSSFNKQMNFLLQQKNDPQRSAAIAMIMEEETQKLRRIQTERWHTERNDFFAMGLGEKGNSASRQIYLTFPADSTFKDEDVSDYFSNFGQVQDVRIPYQQKRMFGFVTFVYPETVKLILARGNPHFICDSRVLVKPYKEKGKVADSCRRQQHQLEIERGDYNACLSPSSLDPRECYDLHAVPAGPRSFLNSQEMMLRRKLEERADLQQAIELQSRRLMNLQLPHMNNERMHHHQRSLSVGPLVSMPTDPLAYVNQNVPDNFNQEFAQDNGDMPEVNETYIDNNGNDNRNEEDYGPIECDSHDSLERFLPDSLFASPTKSSANLSSAFSAALAESSESTGVTTSQSSENNPLPPNTSTSDPASC